MVFAKMLCSPDSRSDLYAGHELLFWPTSHSPAPFGVYLGIINTEEPYTSTVSQSG
jgi:hypothetical protein